MTLRTPALRWMGLGAVAAASLAFAALPSTDVAADAPALAATHTVTVQYQQRRGALRRATVRIVPNGRARAPWRGTPASAAFLTERGWIIIESLRAADGGAYEGRALLPAPDHLHAFALRTDRGDTFTRVGKGYTEVEWTLQANADEEEDPAPNDPAPKDPEPEEPEEPGDDDPGCNASACGGIVDPWTCECFPDTKDPWENEAMDGSSFSFGI